MKEQMRSLRSALLTPEGISALLLISLCCAVWGPLVAAEFSNDDELLIVNNLYIRDFAYVWDNLTRDYFFNSQGSGIGYWRPLTKLTYMVDWAIWGGEAGGYYALNVALFTAVILVGALVMRRAGATLIVAVGAAALAAVNPAHAQSVGIITSRSDLLVAVFLLALIAVELRPVARRFDLAWGTLFCVAALGSKEVGVIAPALVAILHLASRRMSPVDALRCALPYVGLVGMYAVFRLSLGIVPRAGVHRDVPWEWMALATGKVAGIYTARLVLPSSVEPITAYAVFPQGLDPATLGWCALAGLAGLLLLALVWKRELWIPLALIALPIAPSLSLRYITISVHADWLPVFDRGLVLPSLGVGWLFAVALQALAGRIEARGWDRRWALALGAIWWIATLPVAIERVSSSMTPMTRFRPFITAMEKIPSDQWAPFQRRFVLEYRAGRFSESGDLVAAERIYREMLETDPDDPVAKYHLASIYRRTGRAELAVAELRSVLEQKGSSRAHRHRHALWLELAQAEAAAGNRHAAIQALHEAKRLETAR